MNRLKDIEEYKILVREFRKEHKAFYSNFYFMPKDIDRYISLGRVEYENNEEGLFFYFDEESYYRVCMYVEAGGVFSISKRHKKLLVRNIYRKNQQDEKLVEFEKNLERNEFNLAGTSFQIQGRMSEIWKNCSRLEKFFLAMEKKGFRCVEADYSCYKEIEDLILASDIVKDYQMSYLTEQEKQMMIPGSYLCILDKQNQICAASIAYAHDGVARDGVFAVKEEYKMMGIAPMLAFRRLKWTFENKVDFGQGWILTDNDASIRYHKSLGYQWTDKYANDWILQKTDLV
ncbi:MAG: hypothetical protein J1E83_06065 [Lachnospiraceae bacterium]|nr:hypothetical protein [Lachnospiraceae bacterium]